MFVFTEYIRKLLTIGCCWSGLSMCTGAGWGLGLDGGGSCCCCCTTETLPAVPAPPGKGVTTGPLGFLPL